MGIQHIDDLREIGEGVRPQDYSGDRGNYKYAAI